MRQASTGIVCRNAVAGLVVGLILATASSGVSSATADKATDWIENSSYKFRYEGIKRCGSRPLFGFAIRVSPKVGKIFVAPRDVSLALGGVVIDPVDVESLPADQKPSPACTPLLPQKELRPEQSTSGFVLFELPSSFVSSREPLKLAYKPTRWGGAPRVEASVPPCLAECSPAPAAPDAQPAQRKRARR